MKRVIKKTGKQLTGIAKQTVKQVGQEVIEVPKGVGRQAVGFDTQKPSPIVEAMTHSDGKTKDVSPEEKKKTEAITKERVKKIEEEMKMLRERREFKGVKETQKENPPKVKISEPGQRILPESPSKTPRLAMPGRKGPGEKGAEIIKSRR